VVRPAIKSDEVGGRARELDGASRPAGRRTSTSESSPGAWHEPWELAGEDRASQSPLFLLKGNLLCLHFIFLVRLASHPSLERNRRWLIISLRLIQKKNHFSAIYFLWGPSPTDTH
jgi:hypothetical protein